MKKVKKRESSLNEALLKSYIARAKLFYFVLSRKNIEKLFSRVKECAVKNISWDIEKLGISEDAFLVIEKASIPPFKIFCHPEMLNKCPDLIE
jgi:hypothetical protein